MADLKYEPVYRKTAGDLTDSFIKQRRNLMGISCVVILYYLLGAKITSAPTIWGAIELTRIEYIQLIIIILYIYYIIRMYVYQKIEGIKFWFEFLEIFNNKNLKLRKLISDKFEEELSVTILNQALIFIWRSKNKIFCLPFHFNRKGGTGSLHNVDIHDQIKEYNRAEKNGMKLDNKASSMFPNYVSIPRRKLIIPFFRTIFSIKFLFGSCFTDFCLPWVLCVAAGCCFVIFGLAC